MSRFGIASCAFMAIFLVSCSGGGSGSAPITPPPGGTPAPALSYAWTAAFAPGSQTGEIDFPPWAGTWPNVTLATATVTVNAQSTSAVSLVPTAQCATVNRSSASSFVVTQGNNGQCLLVASAGTAALPIVVFAGLPARSVLWLQRDAQSPTTGAIVLDGTTQSATITAYDYLEPLGPRRGTLFTAAAYGGCATVTPASSTAVPSSFAIARIAAGPCFVVISDTEYESQVVSLQ